MPLARGRRSPAAGGMRTGMCARAPLGRGEPETADDLLDRRPGERAARKAAPDFRTEQDVEFESPAA